MIRSVRFFMLAFAGIAIATAATAAPTFYLNHPGTGKSFGPFRLAEGEEVVIGTTRLVISAKPGNASAPAKKPTVLTSRRDIRAAGDMHGTWTALAASVQPGDKVVITASGRWSTIKDVTPCGPEGYAPGSFSSYTYESRRRREISCKYGALLYKIGEGEAKAVGRRCEFVARERGRLYFDINLLPGRSERRGAKGELEVRVEITRPPPKSE